MLIQTRSIAESNAYSKQEASLKAMLIQTRSIAESNAYSKQEASLKANKNSEEQKFLGVFSCTPLGIRTLDPLIKSQLLYQLS